MPETGQKSNATGLSAQGTAGLRRLLEARGHEVIINRMGDGPLIEHGDLEIITFDDDGGTLTYAYHFDSDDKALASSSSEASESEDGDSDYGAAQIPDPKRSKHVLRQPLGKVVLIVAPKWNAGPDPRNRNWDRGPVDRLQLVALIGGDNLSGLGGLLSNLL